MSWFKKDKKEIKDFCIDCGLRINQRNFEYKDGVRCYTCSNRVDKKLDLALEKQFKKNKSKKTLKATKKKKN